MELVDEIEIGAPPQVVWELLVDVGGLPRVTPTITAAERLDDGPLTVGSRVRLTQPGARPAVWTVTELDAPLRFAWSTRRMGVVIGATHELEATDLGCRQTLRVRLEGRGAALLARAAAARIQRSLASENAGFREAAERSAS